MTALAPSRDYVVTMARYNAWMNESLYRVCAEMSDAERKKDRGGFFKSIHGVLNHLVLVDIYWLGWFTGNPPNFPSLDAELYADFDALRTERVRLDAEIERWAASLTEAQLAGDVVFRSMTLKVDRKLSLWHAVIHYFNPPSRPGHHAVDPSRQGYRRHRPAPDAGHLRHAVIMAAH
jgi:uncharacterized damage-inducible protein DinB